MNEFNDVITEWNYEAINLTLKEWPNEWNVCMNEWQNRLMWCNTSGMTPWNSERLDAREHGCMDAIDEWMQWYSGVTLVNTVDGLTNSCTVCTDKLTIEWRCSTAICAGGGVRRGQHLAPPRRLGARLGAPQVGPNYCCTEKTAPWCGGGRLWVHGPITIWCCLYCRRSPGNPSVVVDFSSTAVVFMLLHIIIYIIISFSISQ